jgi:hypothetical protein
MRCLSRHGKATHMMPTTEPTPPIRELPVEIEAALSAYATTCFLRGVYDKVREGRLEETECNLRQAIHASLNDQDAALRESLDRLSAELRAQRAMPPIWFGEDPALRERAERLRQIVALANLERDSVRNECFDVWAECGKRIGEHLDALHPGDLADDLNAGRG